MEENSGTSASFLFLEPQASKPRLGPHRYSPSSFSRPCRVTPIFSSAFYLFIIFDVALLFASQFPVNTSPLFCVHRMLSVFSVLVFLLLPPHALPSFLVLLQFFSLLPLPRGPPFILSNNKKSRFLSTLPFLFLGLYL